MKKFKKKLGAIIAIFLAGISLAACQKATASGSGIFQPSQKTEQKQVRPTFFFHGYTSSIKAERFFAEAAEKSGASKQVIEAIVDKNGKVKLSEPLSAKAKNPLVLIGFEDNRNLDTERTAFYAYRAIMAVRKSCKFKQMNLIGHSMGDMTINYLLIDYGQKQTFPKIKKIVYLAGHFNGVRSERMYVSANHKNGKPIHMNANYKRQLVLRKLYPHAKVLNVYGDLEDGSHSDGRVKNSSSKSLRYLVSPKAKSYKEKKFTGPMAQNSRLRENPQVLKTAIRFLWPNS